MRIVTESHVPERIRLSHPLPKPVPAPPRPRPTSSPLAEIMPEIVKTLTKIVQENKPEPMVMPAPVVMPTPTKTWNLSIVRNEDGLISNIIATRVD